jgi:CzcA family heavy metal efflux pump
VPRARAAGLQATLIAFAIRFRGVVIVLAGVLSIYGIYTLARARYDVFPEFAPPQVSIQAEAPGLTSEQVEVLVTQPLENALNGSPGLAALRSTSIQGLSVISVTFEARSDIYLARQLVAERLAAAAAELPAGIPPPSITPLTSSTSTVLVAGLTSRTRSVMDLRTAADWTLRPRLLAVPGVSKVAVFGGEERSLQIQVHPDALIRFDIGMNQVLDAARRATAVRGAGFIDTDNQRVTLQTEAQSVTPDELRQVVLSSHEGASITLGDVADVVMAPMPAIGGALIEETPGVQLVIAEQYGANTLEVTRGVEAALAELTPLLERDGIDLRSDLFRPADFILRATRSIGTSLIVGGVLVVLVVFLFLYDWRSGAVACAAIPLSLLAAVIVLDRFGAALNTMTLGGLAIAIGVVVDDAVIGIENIVRRVRENARLTDPRTLSAVILDACLEVRSAVVYATFTVILVMLPVLVLPGIAGRLFAPLATAYILAVLASLVVALIVTPALAMVTIAAGGVKPTEPWLMRRSKALYGMLAARVARKPRGVISATLALAIGAVTVLPFFGTTFVPELKEGHFILHMSAVPGTSISESLRIGRLVTRALHEIPGVRAVSQRVGRAESADDTWGTHYSETEVDLDPIDGEEGERVQEDIREVLADFPGVNFAIKPFLTERVEETLTGFTASVVVNVFGNDLDVLDRKAQEIAQALSRIPDAADVQVQSAPGMPQLEIRLRPEDLRQRGFDPVDVLDLIRAGYEGEIAGQVYEANRTFDLLVRLDEASRRDVAAVGDLPLRAPSGAYVRLGQVADIQEISGRYQVLHDGARRLASVTANVTGGDVGTFVKAARAAISTIALPTGTYITFGGAAEAQAESQRNLLLNTLIALIGIVLLVSIITRNTRNLLLVLVNLPFALIGGVIAVFGLGGLLSLGSMVGFVTLFGITLRNSILMIAHYEHLVAIEGQAWNLETAIRGASDRLTPILMTSIVTGLGLLPLAIAMNAPGHEIEGPMAVVILGGLITSLFLNLLVLPALSLRFGRFEFSEP